MASTHNDFFNHVSTHPNAIYSNSLQSTALIESGSKLRSTTFGRLDYVYDSTIDAANGQMRIGGSHEPVGWSYSFAAATSGAILFIWDTLLDQSMKLQSTETEAGSSALKRHKAFQVGSPDIGGGGRWLNLMIDYSKPSSAVSTAVAEQYMIPSGQDSIVLGVGSARGANDRLTPQLAAVEIGANTWARYYVLIENSGMSTLPAPDSSAIDWRYSEWVSDENRDVVQTYSSVNIRTDSQGIDRWWLEWDTSQDSTVASRDRDIWTRNIIVIQSTTVSISSLFTRPFANSDTPATSNAAFVFSAV